MLEFHFEPGSDRTAAFLVFVGFLVSFIFIRTSARLMRSPKVPWWPGSVVAGGLHIHHLVWGIVLLLLMGFLGFALESQSPWTEIAAGLFGIGAGLTLDEFALWLRLKDVYWSDQGRTSIDAVVIAALFGGLVVLGFGPVEFDDPGSTATAITIMVVHLAIVAGAFMKGRILLGVAGFFIPFIALVAVLRLARPGSPWAHHRYAADSGKLKRAEVRFARVDARMRRITDLIGGRPSTGSST
jgi:hypothetical protein